VEQKYKRIRKFFEQEVSHVITVAKKYIEIFTDDDRENQKIMFMYTKVSDIYFHLSYIDLAEFYINECIALIERLLGKAKTLPAFDSSHLASLLFEAYANKGAVCNSKAEYSIAIKNLDESISIGEQLLIDDENLAVVHMSRSISYHALKDYATATIDAEISVRMIDQLHYEGNLRDKNWLAMIYTNRADLYVSMMRYNEALADYNKSIEFWEKMRKEGEVINKNHLARAYIYKDVAISKVMFKKNEKPLYEEGQKKYRRNTAKALLDLNFRKKNLGGESK